MILIKRIPLLLVIIMSLSYFSSYSSNIDNDTKTTQFYYTEVEDELEEINSLARSMSKAVSLEENPSDDAYVSILEDKYKDSDKLLNIVYKKLINSLNKVDKNKIRNEQRKWVKETYEKADKMEKFDRLYFLAEETQIQTLKLAQIYDDNKNSL